MAQRAPVGEWWLLWLLIDPSVRPAHHRLGKVFDVGVVLDSWVEPGGLRLLSEVGAPEACDVPVVRRRLEGLRARGVCPLVRVVIWRSEAHSRESGAGLERWGRLAFGLDRDRGTTPGPSREAHRLGQQVDRVVAGENPWGPTSLAEVSERPFAVGEVPVGRLRSSGSGPVGCRAGAGMVAVGEWDVDDYVRIRAAERVRVPPDTAVLVQRLKVESGGPDPVSAAGSGRLEGLGVLPVTVHGGLVADNSVNGRLCRFDSDPLLVVIVRNQLMRSPLPRGLVLAVGRVQQRPLPRGSRVVEAADDDLEVVALRRRLLHRVLEEPPYLPNTEVLTLWPSPVGGPESRHAS